ncbi:MAG TPA: OsmC family protein [Gemmatimonadales bacterium]
MTAPAPRHYDVQARSTDTFGRVLASCRDHHFIVDGPVQNGCPGEAVTPAELFLASVACCGVELIQVIARETATPLEQASVAVTGTVDRSQQPRPDVTVFNSVLVKFELQGPTESQATDLVAAFKRR